MSNVNLVIVQGTVHIYSTAYCAQYHTYCTTRSTKIYIYLKASIFIKLSTLYSRVGLRKSFFLLVV